jgi:hypothetical protein
MTGLHFFQMSDCVKRLFVVDEFGARVAHPDTIIEMSSLSFRLVWVISLGTRPTRSRTNVCSDTNAIFPVTSICGANREDMATRTEVRRSHKQLNLSHIRKVVAGAYADSFFNNLWCSVLPWCHRS